ncbi:protein kinase [Nonomuraea sp. NPDC046570]|uniref:serine/threonine protein kinase n=1 Tax=Nonomuraea sp. NPDC046570 TaxID=3155255 RepID=UPI0033F022B0
MIGKVPAEGQRAPEGTARGQGRLVGRRYRLMSPVGRGGMGVVWHAHDVLLDRDVAVKELILPYGLDHTGAQVAHRRVLREARSAARLGHPGIVTVHDVVEEDGRPWIVMELFRAWSLEQAVRQSGPLPVVQAAEIGIRVLDALSHAHAAGILHRDVKPGNVLLTADRVVLTDFGIAAIEGDVSITQTGLLMGSPAYIPPERLSGQPITQAADLWSFGATLYAAVEGRPPYEGPDAIAVLGAVLTQEPVRPVRAGALLPVIEGLLRKNPAERMTSEQVSDLLEAVLRSHGSSTTRGTGHIPTPSDSTPMHLLPPLDPPSGPLPSRIVETPSGPVRVAYDPAEPSGGYAMPYDSLSGSAAHRTEMIIPPAQGGAGFDAFGSASGGGTASGGYDVLNSPSGPHGAAPSGLAASESHEAATFGGPSGPHSLGGPSGPHSFGGASGPHSLGDASGPHDLASFGSSSGPYQLPGLGGSSGPHEVAGFGGPSGAHEVAGPADSGRGAARLPGSDGVSDARLASGTPSGARPAFDPPPEPQPVLPPGVDSRDLRSAADGDHVTVSPWPLSPEDVVRRPGARSGTRGKPSEGPPSRRSRRSAGNGWTRDGRPTARLIVSALGAVGVAVVALMLVTSGNPPSETLPTTSSAPPAQPPATIPDGFKEHTPDGFSAAVPSSWKLSTSGGEATFTGPKDSGMKITVEQTTPQADGGVSDLTRLETDSGVEAYIQVQLQPVAYNGWKAADWEYTYTLPNGVPMQTLTRHVTLDDKTAFTITFTMPQLKWSDEAKTRQTFFNTFRPTT